MVKNLYFLIERPIYFDSIWYSLFNSEQYHVQLGVCIVCYFWIIGKLSNVKTGGVYIVPNPVKIFLFFSFRQFTSTFRSVNFSERELKRPSMFSSILLKKYFRNSISCKRLNLAIRGVFAYFRIWRKLEKSSNIHIGQIYMQLYLPILFD